jgi:hypothetical protein
MGCCLFADAAIAPLFLGGFAAVAALIFAVAITWAGVRSARRSTRANRPADEPPADNLP